MNNIKPFTCPICGLVTTLSSVKYHLKKHLKSDEDTVASLEKKCLDIMFGTEVVDKYVSDYKTGQLAFYEIPLSIQPYIKALGIKRTSSEERNTERYKRKYLESIQKRYGEGIVNVSQVKEVQKKKEESFAKTYGSYEEYMNQFRSKGEKARNDMWKDPDKRDQIITGIKESTLNKYGVDNVSKIPEVAKKISETQIKKCSSMSIEEKREMTKRARSAITHNPNQPSTIEVIVWEILEELGYTIRHNVWFGKYNLDVVIDSINTVLDVYGTHWHADPNHYKEDDVLMPANKTAKEIWDRDAHKKDAVERSGMRYLCLWEDTIRGDRNKLKEELKRLLGGI